MCQAQLLKVEKKNLKTRLICERLEITLMGMFSTGIPRVKIPVSKCAIKEGDSGGRKEDEQNLQKSLMGPSGWQEKETIQRQND